MGKIKIGLKIGLAIGLIIIAFMVYNALRDIRPKTNIKIDSVVLSEIISPASELVTYKYFYTTADIYEKNTKIKDFVVPFTTDKSVYVVDGVVSAGIDLEGVDFDVDNNKKSIKVSLPQPKLLSHEIKGDSFKSFDVKNSVFTETSLKDFGELEEELKKKQEEKLEDNEEFWRNVRNQAKDVISNLISASGALDEYKINFEFK